MSKLQELCARLTERGVEPTLAPNGGYVKWPANEAEFMAFEHDGALSVCQLGSVTLSPEEAIRATLGAGTCKLINAADDLGKGTSSCMCFECGYTALDDWWDEFKYCPNCGRRVDA